KPGAPCLASFARHGGSPLTCSEFAPHGPGVCYPRLGKISTNSRGVTMGIMPYARSRNRCRSPETTKSAFAAKAHSRIRLSSGSSRTALTRPRGTTKSPIDHSLPNTRPSTASSQPNLSRSTPRTSLSIAAEYERRHILPSANSRTRRGTPPNTNGRHDHVRVRHETHLFPRRPLAAPNLVHQPVDILFADAAVFSLRPPISVDIVPPGPAFITPQCFPDQLAHGAALFFRN